MEVYPQHKVLPPASTSGCQRQQSHSNNSGVLVVLVVVVAESGAAVTILGVAAVDNAAVGTCCAVSVAMVVVCPLASVGWAVR